MRSIFLSILFFATSLYSTTICKDTVETVVEKCQANKDSLNKIISDNITVETIQKTQELYNTSFSNMQESFVFFLTLITIIISLATIFNYKTTNDLKEEAKDKLKEMEKEIKKLDKDLKKHDKKINVLENINNIVNDITKDTNNNMKDEEKEEQKKKAENVEKNPKASEYEIALAEAAKHYYSDDCESTLKSYENILEKYKEEITITRLSQIYFRIAHNYIKMANPKKNKDKEALLLKAKEKYSQALGLDSKDADAYYNIGYTLIQLAKLKTETEEAFLDEAEKVCIESMNLGGNTNNLVCVYVMKYNLTKKSLYEDNVFKYLEKTLERKEISFDDMEKDEDLKFLNRNDQRYKKLKDKYG